VLALRAMHNKGMMQGVAIGGAIGFFVMPWVTYAYLLGSI
jgi:hypothetical protein